MSDYSKDPCPLENPIASNSITGEKVFLFAFQPIKSGEFSACVMASSEDGKKHNVDRLEKRIVHAFWLTFISFVLGFILGATFAINYVNTHPIAPTVKESL
jgi:hypothetical protein